MKNTSFFSLRALEIFSHVAKHKNFTKAAAELNISQSAVSHQIKKLELDLNTPLIIRNNKKIELSDAGVILHKSVTSSLDNIYKTIDKITSTKRQSVTIHVTPTFGRYWLSPLLPTLWQAFPDVEIIVYYDTPNTQSNITVDIDIAWHNQSVSMPPDTPILMYNEQVPICKKDYLSTCGIHAFDDLNKAVLLYEGHKHHWEKWADSVGLDMRQSLGHNLDDFSNIMFFVNKGEGIALSRVGYLKDILNTGKIDIVSSHTITSEGFYSIHLNPYTQSSTVIRRIYDFIINTAQRDNKNIKKLLSQYSVIK